MKSSEYDAAFVKKNVIGPNSMKIVEEMAESLKLEKGMRVLDPD
jgi:cyclopropane fatty-acyl-phospholipid synthase-like methyltransferase